MRHTEAALHWIAAELDGLGVPYEIDGGLAAIAYGAVRELADIDINVRQEDFGHVAEHVAPHVTWGPAWYKDAHWHCYMLTLNYGGQDIDITALGQISYFDKPAGAWRDYPDNLATARLMKVGGIEVPVVDEGTLIIQKERLARGVDLRDVRELAH